MQKKSLIACVGAFSMLVGGCTSEQSSSPPASPSPTVQPFSKPLVSEKAGDKVATLSAARIPGLLQSTNPDERARQVQAGINVKKNQNDPFASLAPLITFKTPAGTSGTPGAAGIPGGSSPSGSGTGERTASLPQLPSFPQVPQPIASRRSTPRSSTPPTQRPTSRLPTPSVAFRPSTPTITALPPLPEPTLARAVEVSGVVVVGGVAEAIVKAPNEATSRYVRAGQRLSNGQILVKRIEVNGGSDPVVILEQNGIEVSRAVGDKAAPAGSSPTAIAPTFQFRV